MERLDTNKFKLAVKKWISSHPNGCIDDITNYCEEIIPPNLYMSYSWLVDQTICWYKSILNSKKSSRMEDDFFDED